MGFEYFSGRCRLISPSYLGNLIDVDLLLFFLIPPLNLDVKCIWRKFPYCFGVKREFVVPPTEVMVAEK